MLAEHAARMERRDMRMQFQFGFPKPTGPLGNRKVNAWITLKGSHNTKMRECELGSLSRHKSTAFPEHSK